jgi:hypothetical protein
VEQTAAVAELRHHTGGPQYGTGQVGRPSDQFPAVFLRVDVVVSCLLVVGAVFRLMFAVAFVATQTLLFGSWLCG